LSTGIESPDFRNSITLYPNPTSGKVILSFDGAEGKDVVINVLNILGNTMKAEKIQTSRDQVEINMEGLPRGTYFVRMQVSGQTVIKTVILK
jgi:hypothetical protein